MYTFFFSYFVFSSRLMLFPTKFRIFFGGNIEVPLNLLAKWEVVSPNGS